jgi:hypothetical protein
MRAGESLQDYLRDGGVVRIDTFKDFTQSAQSEGGGKLAKEA